MMVKVDNGGKLIMKVIIVKEVMSCDVSPAAMFLLCFQATRFQILCII